MTDLSEKFAENPKLEYPPNRLPKDFREDVSDYIDEYRGRFQEEMKKEIPRHPYKVMMEIRKENGLYGSYSKNKWDWALFRALKELYQEYKVKWEQKKKAGVKS